MAAHQLRGAWADRICDQVGEPVPLEAIAPMMLVSLRLPHFLDPVVIGTGRPLSFKQTADGTVLIGGGRRAKVDRDAETTDLDLRELGASARRAQELFPVMREAVVNRGWAALLVTGRPSRRSEGSCSVAPEGE